MKIFIYEGKPAEIAEFISKTGYIFHIQPEISPALDRVTVKVPSRTKKTKRRISRIATELTNRGEKVIDWPVPSEHRPKFHWMTPEDRKQIKKLRKEGFTNGVIAKKTGFHRNTVQRCK